MRRLGLSRYSNGRLLLMLLVTLLVVAYGWLLMGLAIERFMTPAPTLLTDPFLQLPSSDSVRVLWFTEFEGQQHQVEVGQQRVSAATTKLSRVREDQDSKVGQSGNQRRQTVARDIWRHEAEVSGLTAQTRLPYRVISVREDGRSAASKSFTLAPLPTPGTPQKILLTSDHQLMPMTAANLQKVVEAIGQPDAVFLAGDLVNIGDRASEWFDDNRGRAFFPCLQGRSTSELEKNGVKTRYTGGEIIQHAPLFAAIGNHEVMGRFSTTAKLNDQFGDPYPQAAAALRYRQIASQVNPTGDPAIQAGWIKDHSFNTDTFREIFSLPGYPYYATTFGDVRLIVLYATNIWRSPDMKPDAKGRYLEGANDLDAPDRWGYGQHIFEPIAKGSPQYNWLQAELKSPEFQQAKYKLVMFHHPPHSLGDNIVPAYTNPVQSISQTRERVDAVRYEYPIAQDYLIRDVVPLLESAGVQLVYYGHSHLWNRFANAGTHYLESSNVGNTYGAFWGDKRRNIPEGYREKYVAVGNPNGLEPIVPSIAPLTNEKNQPLPYISSNDISVFSIFDTGTGTVSSYRFDTKEPRSAVVKFDEFSLKK